MDTKKVKQKKEKEVKMPAHVMGREIAKRVIRSRDASFRKTAR